MDSCGPDSYYYWIRRTSGWLTLHILDMFVELLADADRTSFGTPPKCPLLRGLNWKVQRRKS